MAKLMRSGGAHPPADTATTTNTATTAPAAPATTGDREINISVVMPEGTERNANTGYAAGRSRGYGPRQIFDADCTTSYVLNSGVTKLNLTKFQQGVQK